MIAHGTQPTKTLTQPAYLCSLLPAERLAQRWLYGSFIWKNLIDSPAGDGKLFEDAGDDVVVVGLGDLGAIEGAGNEGFVGAEVVDEDLAVDLGGVQWGAAFP